MLSLTPRKESCSIEVLFSIIEFISFNVQLTKGSKTKGRQFRKHLMTPGFKDGSVETVLV